jgi:hypothetical protein
MRNSLSKQDSMKTRGRVRARQLVAVAGPLAAAALAVAAAHAQPAGLEVAATPAPVGQDYGPFTCLVGFVWREAVLNDFVCVTPDVRSQAKQDNALAASRRSPNGGPFGPDTCLSGYVWREAVANDHVCVTPATREQARNDNLAAASRRNDLRTAVGTYGSTPRYYVRTDRINVGTARVFLYDSATRRFIRGWKVFVRQHPTAPGGLLYFRTGVLQCSGPVNAYFRVQDGTSTRRSSRRYVCASV